MTTSALSFLSANHSMWADTIAAAETYDSRASSLTSSVLDAVDAADQRIEDEREAEAKKNVLKDQIYHHLVAVGRSDRGMAPEPIRSPGGHLTASAELAGYGGGAVAAYVTAHPVVAEEAKQCNDVYCAATELVQRSIKAAMEIAAKAIADLCQRQERPEDIMGRYKRDLEVSLAGFMPPVTDGAPTSTTGAWLDPVDPANSSVELSSFHKSATSISTQATIDASTGHPIGANVQQVTAVPQESSRTLVTNFKKSSIYAPSLPATKRPAPEPNDDFVPQATLPAPSGARFTKFNKSLLDSRGSRNTRRPTPEPVDDDDSAPLSSSPIATHPYARKNSKRDRSESSVDDEDQDAVSDRPKRHIKKMRSSTPGVTIKLEVKLEDDEEL